MVRSVRGGDTVARLGGDEFVVLLEPLDEQASAVTVADRLGEEVSRPFLLSSGRTVRVGASIGVALSQDGATDPDLLLNEADVAVYRAKAEGRGRTEVFDAGLRRELAERTVLESAIVTAIRDEELVLHYQPIVNVLTGADRGLRGPRPVEPSGRRSGPPGRLPPGRRAVGPDLRHRRVGAATGRPGSWPGGTPSGATEP